MPGCVHVGCGTIKVYGFYACEVDVCTSSFTRGQEANKPSVVEVKQVSYYATSL